MSRVSQFKSNFNNKNFINLVDGSSVWCFWFLVHILLLVFMNWLFYHIRTDIAVNAATTNLVSCKPISGIILKL
jgi:hypothetical protein